MFPERGAQAAEALEKALAENAYGGLTDPAQFAMQLTEQLRAITKDGHVRVIFGSPFGNQPTPASPAGCRFRGEAARRQYRLYSFDAVRSA